MISQATEVTTPILVIDDDREFRSIIQEALEEDGLTVDAAADGWQGLKVARERPPALVVLDWGLPLMNGGEVASRLRATLGDDLRIVLITADGRAAEKAKQARASAYLAKPLDLDTFISTVRQCLRAST